MYIPRNKICIFFCERPSACGSRLWFTVWPKSKRESRTAMLWASVHWSEFGWILNAPASDGIGWCIHELLRWMKITSNDKKVTAIRHIQNGRWQPMPRSYSVAFARVQCRIERNGRSGGMVLGVNVNRTTRRNRNKLSEWNLHYSMGIYVITFVRENGKRQAVAYQKEANCSQLHAHTHIWSIHASVFIEKWHRAIRLLFGSKHSSKRFAIVVLYHYTHTVSRPAAISDRVFDQMRQWCECRSPNGQVFKH